MSDPDTVNIVGVGASAGGLEAFKRLLQGAAKGQGLAYVLVQHLDPTHESLMADLLGKVTELGVREIADDDAVEADHVYVIPPGRYVHLKQGRLRLSKPKDERGSRIAVDELFFSLAEQRGRAAVGVVLSGTGSDGTAGLKAIKAAGGLAIAQSPETAAHDSMPRSVIDQGLADFILAPEEVPDAITRFIEHPYVQNRSGSATDTGPAGFHMDGDTEHALEILEEPTDDAPPTGRFKAFHHDDYEGVIDLLESKLGVELSAYKQSSVVRRIQRRMGLNQMHALPRYLYLLRNNERELEHLARDMHINVTEFFRDGAAFEMLEKKALPKVFESAVKAGRSEVRIWVPGCATGEEAYSLAIALYETRQQDEAFADLDIQIFASDVDEEAIRAARQATYPEILLTGLSKQRRERFFVDQEDQPCCKVRQFLRDMISFARHDLLADPPFSRMDLISCRNLLIYFRRSAQAQAIELFHFALRRHGHLWLGPSESLGKQSSLFRVVDAKWRLYERLDAVKRVAPKPFSVLGDKPARGQRGELRVAETRHQPPGCEVASAAERVLVEAIAPAAVVLNEKLDAIYLHGELEEFLNLPRGIGNLSFMDMLRQEVRTRVRAAVYRAAREAEPVITAGRMLARDGTQKSYQIKVQPCRSRELGDQLLTVSFELADLEENGSVEVGAGSDAVTSELERELQATREDLRATVEALENANEELRASNEEAMTMNEELQSTNEELETQSEELRSVNEELITVNAQLREKIDQVQEAHADIANLLTSTKLPAVFLDRGFCIRRYTPEAQKLLSVIETDIGRPIQDLAGACFGDGMLEDAKDVLEGLAPVEKEIQAPEGDWYLRRILPYRTDDDRIAGVVITFTAVTRLKRLTAQQARQRDQQAAVVDLGLRALREHEFVKLANHACKLLSKVLVCELVKVLELTEDHSELRLLVGKGWKRGLVGNATVPNSIGSQAGFTLQHAGPVVVPDLPQETRFSGPALLTEHRVKSGVSVILHGVDTPYGVLGVHTRKPRDFNDDEVDFVQQIANVLAAALQRLGAEDALRRSERLEREYRERLQLARDAAGLGIHVYHIDTGEIEWDRRVRALWGVDDDTPITFALFIAGLHPDDREPTQAAVNAALDPKGEGRYHAEYRVLNQRDGMTRWVAATGLVRFAKRQPVTMIGTVADITEQKNSEMHLRTVMSELNHRVKNTIATIDAIAQQTGVHTADMASFLKSFSQRLRSIGAAHSILTETDWKGADLRAILEAELTPRVGRMDQLKLQGPDVTLKPQQAMALHMTVHEMATNAAKYGALSESGGAVTVTWAVRTDDADSSGDWVELSWREDGGPEIDEPDREGFGSTMIQDLVTYELNGQLETAFRSEGLRVELRFPLTNQPRAARAVGLEPKLERSRRVLIVEDQRPLARLVCQQVSARGWDPIGPAATADQALSLLDQITPDAALLDVNLGGHRVYPVAQRLRKSGVPFAFVTGYNQIDLPTEFQDAPRFTKPVNEGSLIDWLKELWD